VHAIMGQLCVDCGELSRVIGRPKTFLFACPCQNLSNCHHHFPTESMEYILNNPSCRWFSGGNSLTCCLPPIHGWTSYRSSCSSGQVCTSPYLRPRGGPTHPLRPTTLLITSFRCLSSLRWIRLVSLASGFRLTPRHQLVALAMHIGSPGAISVLLRQWGSEIDLHSVAPRGLRLGPWSQPKLLEHQEGTITLPSSHVRTPGQSADVLFHAPRSMLQITSPAFPH
jgi:hypothetical protein